MNRNRRCCRCCYSAETLEKLCSPALDAYMSICNHKGLGNDITQLFVCHQCHKFLKEVHNFKIERCTVDEISYKNLDVKHQKADLMLSDTIVENSSWINVKTETKEEHNVIDGIDIKINTVEPICNVGSFKEILETSTKTCSKSFNCSRCSFKTTTKESLKSHIFNKHSDEKPFTCDKCNYRCKSRKLLLMHKKNHLSESEKPHKCNECSYTTTTTWNLKCHIALKHSDERPFVCDQCDYRSKTKQLLSIHVKRHSTDREKPYKCSECSYTTTTNRYLQEHVSSKHRDEFRFFCDQCNYRSKLQSLLFKHQNIHFKDRSHYYNCGQCSYVTPSMWNLKCHIWRNHSGVKLFECNDCGHYTKTKSRLFVHMKTHLKDCDKPYRCNECSYTTTTMGNLKTHVAYKHSDEKPFSCDQCDYRSKLKALLIKHKETHSKDRIKPFNCSECSFSTTTMWNLKCHVGRKHSDEKPFSCDQCNYRAKTKSRVTVHKKTHLKDCDKPHKCIECSYTTTTTRHLISHVALKHSDEKPFSCDQCNYRCKLKSLLSRHKRTHYSNGKDCDKPFYCSECSYTTSTNDNLKAHIASNHYEQNLAKMMIVQP